MRELDSKSLAIAALIGGALLALYAWRSASGSVRKWFIVGALLGVGVQVGERFTGAS